MNKKQILDKIKQLDSLTNDEKAYLVNLINTKKKYGLVWEDKPEDVEEQLRHSLPVLREVPEKRILATDLPAIRPTKPKTTQTEIFSETEMDEAKSQQPKAKSQQPSLPPNHLLIEGDNLHALTALTFTHEGKIDVIYIDPPYNTGSKDFKYNDHFVDKEDSYRHSKWLSFMHKRLEIAKRLLSDKGVIFISIDDNEQAQLKMLCDSIFGEVNCIGPIIQNKQNAKNDTINIQKNHEYILVYRKTCQFSNNNKVIPNLMYNDFKTKNVFVEGSNYYYLNDAITTRGEGGILNARPNLGHTIYFNPETKDIIAVCDYDTELAKISNDPKLVYSIDSDLVSKGYISIRPPKVRGKLGCWTWSKEKVNEEKNDLVVTGKLGSYSVKKRTFVNVNDTFRENGKLYFKSNSESNSRSLIDYSTNDGTEKLNEVLTVSGKFNNPKNLEMLKYFVALIPAKNFTILDFFAGSGTTLHATMQLNAEDGGNRQCIMVTNNENNICEEVTYERNKRVIQGYTNAKGAEVPGLTHNNLRYYKSEFVGREPSLKNKRKLTQLATDLLCIKEDCYNNVTSLLGNRAWHNLFTDSQGKFVYIVYDDIHVEEAVTLLQLFIAQQGNETAIKVYVFANGQYAYAEEFEDIAQNITLAALPDAIYKAYQNILPKQNKDFIPELEEDTPAINTNLELF